MEILKTVFRRKRAKPYYHLMHCVPHRKLHGLNGYYEVIETVAWGLKQLGNDVVYGLNQHDPEAINITFGEHVFPVEYLESMPKNTICYNLEQIRNLDSQSLNEQVKYVAQNFTLWDYSAANLETWAGLGRADVQVVPIGYAPILTRIPKAIEQDIDVLIFGSSSETRLHAFDALTNAGLTVIFVCGLYGKARDDLITRAKIVLNVNKYHHAQVFEIVRASYLLANRKAVVSTLDANTFVEEEIKAAIKFTTMETLLDDCIRLLKNDAERCSLEEYGYELMSKRDIRAILSTALSI
ncbi:MAG: hypothetical protein JO269_12300 [Burkholderiaceae bacterium]|nr:hypothetical protein [Burkholderiaceae bacterium]